MHKSRFNLRRKFENEYNATQRIISLCLSFFIAYTPLASSANQTESDDETERVIITGQRDCTGILSEKCGWGDFGDPFYTPPDPGYNPEPSGGEGEGKRIVVETAEQARERLCDTRCNPLVAAEGLSDTLSTSSAAKRDLVAKQIATHLNASRSSWDKIIDSAKSLILDQTQPNITVTFADGGSETYKINFIGSDVAYSPVTGSLVKGTGKVEEKNCFTNMRV